LRLKTGAQFGKRRAMLLARARMVRIEQEHETLILARAEV
jgi:hypothetical protein